MELGTLASVWSGFSSITSMSGGPYLHAEEA